MKGTIHRTSVGTFHPSPDAEPAWTVHDSRGCCDDGPPCDQCGACECSSDSCRTCDDTGVHDGNESCIHTKVEGCIGLSFAYVCLDGGETLCELCWEIEDAAGNVPDVVVCDCP